MSKIHYTQYVTNSIDAIDLEELLNQLQDFFLQSGFPPQHGYIGSHDQNLPNLYQALADILVENEKIPQNLKNPQKIKKIRFFNFGLEVVYITQKTFLSDVNDL